MIIRRSKPCARCCADLGFFLGSSSGVLDSYYQMLRIVQSSRDEQGHIQGLSLSWSVSELRWHACSRLADVADNARAVDIFSRARCTRYVITRRTSAFCVK